jgi:hypothetical protein
MYFTLLNRIKHLVETNKEYHKLIEKNNNHKNDIQSNIKQQAIYELQCALKTDYIHLFDNIELQ